MGLAVPSLARNAATWTSTVRAPAALAYPHTELSSPALPPTAQARRIRIPATLRVTTLGVTELAATNALY